MEIIDQLWVAVPYQDANLKDEAAKQERNEDDNGVDGVADGPVLFVRVKQPSDGDVSRRHFDEKENDAENHSPVHEGQRADKGDKSDHMVANHLLIDCREGTDNDNNTECIGDEIAASVDKRPNVKIARRPHAVLIIKHGLTVTAHFKHGQGGKHDAQNGVNRTD